MERDTDLRAYTTKLERENRYLKSLLDQAGISYDLPVGQKPAPQPEASASAELMHQLESAHSTPAPVPERSPEPEAPAPVECADSAPSQDQMAPKSPAPAAESTRLSQEELDRKNANWFLSRFQGRTDLFALHYENQKTGKKGYVIQCENEWAEVCHKNQRNANVRCKDCSYRKWKKLTLDDIIFHLRGVKDGKPYVVGIYPLFPDNTCRFIVLDFDNHDKGSEQQDYANEGTAWREEVDTLRQICALNGIDALTERSRSGKGAHVWILFREPVEAALARKFGDALLVQGTRQVNLKNFRYFDRMLPMQDRLPEGGVGNLIALPMQGQALMQGNSAFLNDRWEALPDQWTALKNTTRYSRAFLEEKIQEWGTQSEGESALFSQLPPDDEKPWEKTAHFSKMDVEGSLRITLADGLYVESANLQPRIQNRIRELAAFSNPVFYKTQKMGFSTFGKSRFVYLGSDENGYLKLPRGTLERITRECQRADIPYTLTDERCAGRPVRVEFQGELRGTQPDSVQAMLEHDNGILHAATAFGKTVVCCSLIAQRKTSALILVESSELINQWREALKRFLAIDEQPPEYLTKTGRVKRRDSVVGVLQGGRPDTTTGIIDIAMVRSVCTGEGEFHFRLKDYGMILLDECHHAASKTITEILLHARAKYVYGVTATPGRGDRLERINYLLLGPIRYRFSAKDRAEEQGIAHLVYPRFTRCVVPTFQQGKLSQDDLYKLLIKDRVRNRFIVEDVKACVARGRTPVILSKYRDHVHTLCDLLQNCADHVFLMTGEEGQKQNEATRNDMMQVPREESMILLATGSLLGEGFDFPRLDTLIMATPVAGENVVTQYAGRLNRDYEGKQEVFIYDYVDSHIQVFEKMYHKRLRAYKQIGFELVTEESKGKQTANAIYDTDDYADTFQRDLLEANREIILSSPTIQGDKVDGIIQLLREKQEKGLRVTVITQNADGYQVGDPSDPLALQEDLRTAGFEVNLVRDDCPHYCVVDREIVWYGSVDLLGKEDVEDNLMRVCSAEIAAELLERTFGSSRIEPFPLEQQSLFGPDQH